MDYTLAGKVPATAAVQTPRRPPNSGGDAAAAVDAARPRPIRDLRDNAVWRANLLLLRRRRIPPLPAPGIVTLRTKQGHFVLKPFRLSSTDPEHGAGLCVAARHPPGLRRAADLLLDVLARAAGGAQGAEDPAHHGLPVRTHHQERRRAPLRITPRAQPAARLPRRVQRQGLALLL